MSYFSGSVIELFKKYHPTEHDSNTDHTDEHTEDVEDENMKMTHILHDGEDLSGASLGRLHLVAVLDVLDDVSEGDAGVGHAAEGVDLPQQDAEAPHV